VAPGRTVLAPPSRQPAPQYQATPRSHCACLARRRSRRRILGWPFRFRSLRRLCRAGGGYARRANHFPSLPAHLLGTGIGSRANSPSSIRQATMCRRQNNQNIAFPDDPSFYRTSGTASAESGSAQGCRSMCSSQFAEIIPPRILTHLLATECRGPIFVRSDDRLAEFRQSPPGPVTLAILQLKPSCSLHDSGARVGVISTFTPTSRYRELCVHQRVYRISFRRPRLPGAARAIGTRLPMRNLACCPSTDRNLRF